MYIAESYVIFLRKMLLCVKIRVFGAVISPTSFSTSISKISIHMAFSKWWNL